jgi:hypothetical protein
MFHVPLEYILGHQVGDIFRRQCIATSGLASELFVGRIATGNRVQRDAPCDEQESWDVASLASNVIVIALVQVLRKRPQVRSRDVCLPYRRRVVQV